MDYKNKHKEESLQTAEKLLMQIYSVNYEIVARICTASADKDAEYLYHALDEVTKFIEQIKEGLKQ